MGNSLIKLSEKCLDKWGALQESRGLITDEGSRLDLATRGYKKFNLSRRWFILMNAMEIIGGTTKIGIEINNAIHDPDHFNLSALVDGGVDLSLGSSWMVLNSFYAQNAARLAQHPKTLEKGIEILTVHAIKLPPNILLAARTAGMIGPAVGIYMSSQDIYDGVADETLTSGESRHKIISGSLGFASSAAFIGFAFFMTPAAIPVGTVFFVVGLGLLATQTLYDEWDTIIPLMEERIETFAQSFPGKDAELDQAGRILAQAYNKQVYGKIFRNIQTDIDIY